ncbi:hypothetical protein BKA67DRAFT_319170 [Truncatella angustata]|uniref:Uncharacterized protein n=1 Tax=Truncatella angustata TaxID=152316 RepID=A0A9P8UJK2_9PEZI|nr:uncharacterized protein BKA67DRAFT_319170 [Truncatella angustata]KAH6653382.1 hypothetical protein BKA67DRAFT_319170 [Truncatella angustata]
MADFDDQVISFDEVGGWPQFLRSQSRQGSESSQASHEPFADPHDEPPNDRSSRDRSTQRCGRSSLPLLQLADWDKNKSYDDEIPTCIHYSIEWKMLYRKKKVFQNTEPDLVLAPGAYWIKFMKPKLENLAAKKLPGNVHVEDTQVVAIVQDRSVRNLVTNHDCLDIRWVDIEKQIRGWSRQFEDGRSIRLEMIFAYVDNDDDGPSNDVPAQGRGRGRARASATKSMLAARATQIQAEESSGKPTIWVAVYQITRCPGPPCHLDPHCWQDHETKKHYRMKSHNFRATIKWIEEAQHIYET